jgi:glycosyltransferase involved in cell wall biosynthesis
MWIVRVDVVVVAYRSATHLRACIEPLCSQPDITVIVVDNACPESSLSTIADLPACVVEMGRMQRGSRRGFRRCDSLPQS